MELFCLGDSLTFGLGVHFSQRWTNIAAVASGWRIINQGVSGDTAVGMLTRMRTQMLCAPAFCSGFSSLPQVLVMGGCNDIFYSGTDICARTGIGAIIHQLISVGVNPIVGIPLPIIVSDVPPAWTQVVDFYAAAVAIEGYCDWLKRYCRAFGLRYIDFRADFLSPDGTPKRELLLDGMHPTAEGHMLMANRLTSFLNEL